MMRRSIWCWSPNRIVHYIVCQVLQTFSYDLLRVNTKINNLNKGCQWYWKLCNSNLNLCLGLQIMNNVVIHGMVHGVLTLDQISQEHLSIDMFVYVSCHAFGRCGLKKTYSCCEISRSSYKKNPQGIDVLCFKRNVF